MAADTMIRIAQIVSLARAAASAARTVREIAEPVREAVLEAVLDGDIDADEAAEIGRIAGVEALEALNGLRAERGRVLVLGRYSPEARAEAAGYAGALVGVLVVGRDEG